MKSFLMAPGHKMLNVLEFSQKSLLPLLQCFLHLINDLGRGLATSIQRAIWICLPQRAKHRETLTPFEIQNNVTQHKTFMSLFYV